MKQVISTKQLISPLRKAVRNRSLKDHARALGISPQYLHDVINGRRNVGIGLGARLGYEKMVRWKWKGAA